MHFGLLKTGSSQVAHTQKLNKQDTLQCFGHRQCCFVQQSIFKVAHNARRGEWIATGVFTPLFRTYDKIKE